MNPETTFWHYLRDILKKAMLLQRIESGATGLGIPDVLYTYEGHHGFIELKQVKDYPKRNYTRVPLRISQEQLNWLYRHGDRGGFCFVMVKIVVPGHYYLFSHDRLLRIKDFDTQEYIDRSVWHCKGRIDNTHKYSLLNVL